MKYYQSMLAGQPIAGIDFVKFAIVGSCVFGVYATDKSEEIAKLDALVKEQKLSEISQAEYESSLKKKPADPVDLTISNQDQIQAVQPPIKGQGAVVVSESEQEQEVQVPIGQISSTEAALVVAPVAEATPQSAPEVTQQNTRSKKR